MKNLLARCVAFYRSARTLTLITILLTPSFAAFMRFAPVHAIPPLSIVGGAPVNASTGVASPISDVQISGTGNPTVPVHLFVSHGTLDFGTTTGITFTGSSSGGTIDMSGTLTDVNTALATMTYTPGGLSADTLEISLTEAGEVFFPGNDHIYEFVAVPGDIDWTDANTAANVSTKYGLTGYLVTLTSAEENDYVAARLTDAGWMGANDSAVEGDWKWTGGPEAGTSFWSGLSNGSAVGGMFNSWGGGEPNNSGNEDCGQYLSGSNGNWNDLPCTGTTLPGYVVEYGEPGNVPEIASKNVAITTTAATVTVSSCPELQALDDAPGSEFNTILLTQDIDCTGYMVDPLFQDSFYGTFNGQNHTISHVTMNHPGDNYVALFSSSYDGAVFKNVTLTSGSVSGDEYVGSLVAYAVNTDVENVHVDWDVSGNYSPGGILGYFYNDENRTNHLTDSSYTGTVEGGYYAAGLVGEADAYGVYSIERSFVTGAVNTDSGYSGGLVGYAYVYSGGSYQASLTLQDVYVQANVDGTGQNSIGGLIGYAYVYGDTHTATIHIKNGYSSGQVKGDEEVGGIIGYADSLYGAYSVMSLENLFSAGELTSDDASTIGSIIGSYSHGDADIDTSHIFFDATSTGTSICSGGDLDLPGCSAIDTAVHPTYFKDNNVNLPMSDWNFAGIWKTNDNAYPTFGVDDDSDNIPAATEDAAPNSGDANDDGIADSDQDNVTSFVNPVTGQYAVLEAPFACDIDSVASAAEASNAAQDSGYNYPVGLMNFTVSCGTPGYTAQIILYYFTSNNTSFVARKYNPSTHAYYAVPGAVLTPMTIAGQAVTQVTYQVTDGGILDADGAANGVIVDPVGLALGAVGVPDTGFGGGR